QLQRSHSALLNDAEPVAASPDAFVLKFKYDIHCQMASENQTFAAAFSQLLEQYTGKAYTPVYVPDANWLKIREEFIRNGGLKNEGGAQEPEGQEENPFSGDGASPEEDPFVSEAERLFGKDFVEVHDD
ncbi:hypothetical protein RLL78_00665, partial [Streptococcus pneumoniae]|nr:hypothetical protein [Streptococcus pneumoniae]